MRFDPQESSFIIVDGEICSSWVYDLSFYPRTVVTDFDFVCDRGYLVALTQSLFMAGSAVGVLTSGLISDK